MVTQSLRTSAIERSTKIVLNISLKANFMAVPYRKLTTLPDKIQVAPMLLCHIIQFNDRSGGDRELQKIFKYVLNSVHN